MKTALSLILGIAALIVLLSIGIGIAYHGSSTHVADSGSLAPASDEASPQMQGGLTAKELAAHTAYFQKDYKWCLSNSSVDEFDESAKLSDCRQIATDDDGANTKFLKSSSPGVRRRYRHCQKNSIGDDADCRAVAKRQIKMRFTEAEVRASWGSPTHINTTCVEGRCDAQWVYELQSQNVYFSNGLVDGWDSNQ